jgi:threonine dehydratase
MISLADAQTAAKRIAGLVRHTPLMQVPGGTIDGLLAVDLHLKLELLQVTGSFKPRGAFNRALTEKLTGLVTSSGGNHGIAVAHVGRSLGVPAVIPLPASVSPEKLARMRALGAEADVVGPTFQVSNERALRIAAERGYLYIHPFADESVVAGQGTVGLEILEDLPNVDAVIVAVGGGGLLGGVAMTIKEQRPSVRVIGVEPSGADALTRSLNAGRLIALERIDTAAATLAPPFTGQINLELAQRYVDQMVHVSDDEMQRAARWLWDLLAVPAELGGSAATAALLSGRVALAPGSKVVSIVCGAGTAGLSPG